MSTANLVLSIAGTCGGGVLGVAIRQWRLDRQSERLDKLTRYLDAKYNDPQVVAHVAALAAAQHTGLLPPKKLDSS